MDGSVLRKLRNWRGLSIRETAKLAAMPQIDLNMLGSAERGVVLLRPDQQRAVLNALGAPDEGLLELAVGILDGEITTWEQVAGMKP